MPGKLNLESFNVGVHWDGSPKNPAVCSAGVETHYYVNGHRIDERTYRLLEEMQGAAARLVMPADHPTQHAHR